MKLLIVDDAIENLRAINALLVRDDFEIITARSGMEALELMMVHDFFLALLDIQMPEMNGFELAELMRGTNRTKNIPIIFVSGNDKDDRIYFKGHEIAAVDYLKKPLDSDLARSKVNAFLLLKAEIR